MFCQNWDKYKLTPDVFIGGNNIRGRENIKNLTISTFTGNFVCLYITTVFSLLKLLPSEMYPIRYKHLKRKQ